MRFGLPDAGDRTQPGLPLKTGRAGTTTHDYKRPGNGTTTLRAALNVATGEIAEVRGPPSSDDTARSGARPAGWANGA